MYIIFVGFKQFILEIQGIIDNFSLKYNDEYREEFYGWAVACQGVLIDSEMICLHPSEENGGINLFKDYNEEEFVYDPDFVSDTDTENENN